MKRKYLILVVILLLPFTSTLAGKRGIQDTRDQSQASKDNSLTTTDREIRELLDTLRELHLVKELQLPQDKAKLLLEKVRYARKVKQNYLVQRYQIEKKLDTLLELPNPDQAKIQKILQELEAAKMQYYQHIIQADQELRTMLSPEEQAKYVLFQRNFDKRLKEIIVSIRQHSTKIPPKRNFLLRKQDQESVIRSPR